MADTTTIEWTDATWQIVTGCSVVSPGCTNCYAMKLAGTRLRNHPSREGLTVKTKAGPVWNGRVRFNVQWLDQPLRWKRSRRIFVCAHGDLFHESVPDEWLDKVFAVMALSSRHTFQVLTKRASRMREYMAADWRGRVLPLLEQLKPSSLWNGSVVQARHHLDKGFLPNVWLGVSAEDQPRADERIPHLVATPAAKRFVSLEPLLGPINFRWSKWDDWQAFNGLKRDVVNHLDGLRMIDWVILGGESGARDGSRIMHPAWEATIREECAEADVPYFRKQWGDWKASPGRAQIAEAAGSTVPDIAWPDGTVAWGSSGEHGGLGIQMVRVGKKAAGALLDGVEHREFPT